MSERCLYVEQQSLADVLAGMGSGYMLFPHGMYCLPEVRLCIAALCVPITLLYVPLQQMIGLCITALTCALMQFVKHVKPRGLTSHDMRLWLLRLQSVGQCHAMISMHDLVHIVVSFGDGGAHK